jgi:hypothetical protein
MRERRGKIAEARPKYRVGNVLRSRGEERALSIVTGIYIEYIDCHERLIIHYELRFGAERNEFVRTTETLLDYAGKYGYDRVSYRNLSAEEKALIKSWEQPYPLIEYRDEE